MLKTFINALWVIVGLTLSSFACAVGFGGANVQSALGQPLKAEIDLVAVSKAERVNLNVHLASPDAFKAAGLDYPYNLPKLKFDVEIRDNGQTYVKMTSKEVVNEPFLSLLVELTWSSGKLQREFTFLLDPPDYKPEQPQPEEVKPIEPVIVVPAAVVPPVVAIPEGTSAPSVTEPVPGAITPETTEIAPAAGTEPLAPAPTSTEVTSEPIPEVAPAPELSASVPEAAPAASETATAVPQAVTKSAEGEQKASRESGPTVTVRRGDTLGKIAAQLKEPDVTLEQMLVALYRSNAEQFDGMNMNRLRAGKILHMPAEDELSNLSQGEAVKEIRVQTANWNAYRQKLATASPAAPEQSPKQEASGKIATSIEDQAPATKESAKEVLKLSKGEAPGDKTTAGAKAKQQAVEEEAIAKEKAAKAEADKLALLEKNVQDMKKLVDLKAQPVVPVAGGLQAPASAVVAPAAVSGVPPAKVVAKPKVVPTATQPELLDELLDNPLYMGAAAAAVLGVVGFAVVLVRRRGGKASPRPSPKPAAKAAPSQSLFSRIRESFAKTGKKKIKPSSVEEDFGSKTVTNVVAPPVASPATGDFTSPEGGAAKPAAKPAEAEEVDAITEADLFLTFGRDVQAEEVLKEALTKNPSNLQVQLKLLSIYANRKDANAFSTIARKVKDSGDAASWEQAAALGRAVDPSNPMYGGSGEAAAVLPTGGGKAPVPSVDIDVGFSVPMDLDVTGSGQHPVAASVPAMDFDVTSAAAAPMDFNVTGSTPNAAAAGLPQSLQTQVMDFDVTGSQPNLTAAQHMDFDVTSEHADLLATQHLDFDVTNSHPAVAEAAPAESLGLGDLTMDFDISASPVAAASAPATEAPSSTALDLGLTFDISSSSSPVASAAKPVVEDIGLGGISLNLDEVTTLVNPVGESKKDEQWHDVATKLDLAKAYHEMGDADGAREILGEVLRDGDDQQQAAAQALMQQL